jgi:hypothetical protein
MMSAMPGATVFPGSTFTAPSGEKEYSQLETSQIQAACGRLTNAQWDTYLPEIFTRMLDKGQTMAWVRALLKDTFRPDNIFSLTSVHLGITESLLCKDIQQAEKPNVAMRPAVEKHIQRGFSWVDTK